MKTSWSQLCLLILTIALSSCTMEDEVRNKTIYYNQKSGIPTLDPAFARNQAIIWGVHQLYNGLVQFDESLKVVPCIAKSWTISDSGKLLEFILRDDVVFHDNEVCGPRKVKANDFVYSFNRILDENVASSGAWLIRDKVAKTNPFVAVNDSVFQIRLHIAFQPIMGILTLDYFSVVPHEVVNFYGNNFRKHPVGTGPFQLTQWIEHEVLICERNPQYFERDSTNIQLPYMDEIVISFIDNSSTEFLTFLNGDLDFVSDIDPGFKDLVLTRNGALTKAFEPKLNLIKAPFLNTEYLGFNDANLSGGWTHPSVRKALNRSVNKQKLLKYLKNDKGAPAYQGMIPKGLAAYDSLVNYGTNYNLSAATELLAEAGYANGKGLSPLTLHTVPSYVDVCEFIQHQAKQIGLPIELKVMNSSLLRSKMEKGEVGFFRASWIGDYPDAENYMALFYSAHGAPPNYTRHQNSDFDALYIKAFETADPQERIELYQQMDSIVMESSLVIPLFYDEVFRFTQKNIQGLGCNAMNSLELKRFRK